MLTDSKFFNIHSLKVNSFVSNKRANVISAVLASIVHKNKNLLKVNISPDDSSEEFLTVKLYNPLLGL